MKAKYIFITVLIMALNFKAYTASFIWTGNSSSSWSESGNWSGGGGGTPGAGDFVTINSNAPNNLILDQNRSVTNFTINGDTMDLGGYEFTITGSATFNGGKLIGGTLLPTGTLCHFGGGIFDVTITATSGYYHMNGGTFMLPVNLTSSTASTSGTGGCVFNDSLTINNTGSYYFTMGSSGKDYFNGPLTINNSSTHEIYLSTGDSAFFSHNVILNSTNGGGVTFGNTGGVSILATGKTITIGTTGFTNDYLTLKKFKFLGNTSQTLTLTGTAVVNMVNCTFNGSLTVTSPGFLLKDNVFNGATSLTRTASSGNHQSDGGNVFNSSLICDNQGVSGRIRWATTSGDVFFGNATFNSTGGSDVQLCYTGNSYFYGYITINSSKVVFNTSNGKVTFAGGNSQTLNGSYNYSFKKLAINKSANHVTANTTLSVDDSLIFVSGNLVTTATNLLTMKHGSTASGASNSSFVSGPVKKTGNSAFQFPVGKGTRFRTVEITAPTNTTDAFTAEYFDTSQTLGTTMDTTITFISDCGYWNLSRTNGSSNITPKFTFDSTHCDYLTVKPVHIAFWNGTKWVDKGEGVNDSNTKKTSAAVTSYGNFALAYKLMPGDAPQMPYPLTLTTTCNSEELQFTSNDIWFSFTPDSAVIKVSFNSSDTSNTYAYIKSARIFNTYQVGDTLTTVSLKTWPFDSLLVDFQNYVTELSEGNSYLLKVTKFDSTEGPGIYDSIDYFLNLCLFNMRMSINPVIHHYNDLNSLVSILGFSEPTAGAGITHFGDVVIPGSGSSGIFDLSALPFPLLIESGVTFVGNYDLLSEQYVASVPNFSPETVNTSPNGIQFISTKRGTVDQGVLNDQGYMFFMLPESIIRNVRLKGAMPGYQDFNKDQNLCAGIGLQHILASSANPIAGPFNILNCEIYNFSYSGIYSDNNTTGIIVENCHIHHIRGGGGETTAKGYGNWFQSHPTSLTTYEIRNSIFDDCKAAIDLSGGETILTVEHSTIGEVFFQEAINKHNKYTGFDPPARLSCVDFYIDNSTPCSPVDINTVSINDLAAGDISLLHSIFHKKIQLITLPYPANATQAYQIKMNNNTYVASDAPASDFDCNYGGYARIADNYIKACVWDWERNHKVDGTTATNTEDAILEEVNNNFEYQSGVAVSNSPQPPEFDFEVSNALGYVRGFLPQSAPIPFILENSSKLELDFTKGIYGTASQSYVLRAKTALIDNSSITNGYNSYDGNQVVIGPESGNFNYEYDDTEFWNDGTDKLPGLYGVDVLAVDATTNSHRYASTWKHQPIIIAPADDYKFIFHIKDNYYNDLYLAENPSFVPVSGVTKQVELNGHVIWSENIVNGGDDWERIELDLLNDDCPDSSPIRDHFNTNGFKNVLTFSIGMADPGLVATNQNGLRGLMVWVDDIYLKKFDSAENLCWDGDVEGSIKSGLGSKPTPECMFYQTVSFAMQSDCFSLEQSYDQTVSNPTLPTRIADASSYLSSSDRKSGLQSILLELDGIHNDIYLDDCLVYILNGTHPANNALVSAGFDFDVRDLVSCSDVESLFGYTTSTTLTSPISDDKIIMQNSQTLTSDLTIESSDILFETTNPPLSLIVPNGITLTITGNESDSTYIGGCKNMWGGIIVEPGGKLIITGTGTAITKRYVTIEDAYVAIKGSGNGSTTSNEPEIDLTHVKFNKNQLSVYVENDDYASSSIKGCMFQCDDRLITRDPTNPFIYLDSHLLYEDVHNAPDVAHEGSKMTEFKDAFIGIKAIRSDVKSAACEFADLMKNANPLIKGNGIVAENTTSDDKDIEVTSRFSNLNYGISAKGNFNIDVSDGQYYRDISSAAILANSSGNNDINISGVDNFLRCNIGIRISGSNLNNVTIIDNSFTNTGFVETSTGSFHNTAITVQVPTSTARHNTDVEISGNSITNFRIGIHARNLRSLSIGANTTGGIENVITFDQPSFDDNYRGIWVEQCVGALIQGNTIIKSNATIPSGSFTVEGITLNGITNGVLTSNVITELNTPIRFFGSCIGTELHCNTIDNSNNQTGDGVNVEGADVSPQGVDLPGTSSDETWDNLWIGYSSTTNGIVGVSAQQFDWFFNPALTNGEPFPELGSANAVGITPYNPDGCTLNIIVDVYQRDAQFGKIVEDSLDYSSYEDVFKFSNKDYLFQLINADTTLLTRSTNKDSTFRNFYDQTQQTNISIFYTIDSLIRENALDGASDLNASINDTTTWESNFKTIYNILINKVFRDSALSGSDSSTIEAIAIQHPLVGGRAVLWARAMLFLEIHDNSALSRFGNESIPESFIEEKSIEQIEMTLVPNPASDNCVLHLQGMKSDYVIYVTNIIGEKVFIRKVPINVNSVILDTQAMPAGIYFVSATDGVAFSKTSKLVIAK